MNIQAIITSAAKGTQDEASTLFRTGLLRLDSLDKLILAAYCNGAILGMQLGADAYKKSQGIEVTIEDNDPRLDVALDRALSDAAKL